MVRDRPILSGVALPGNCRYCQKVIYPGNGYFVHADASADEEDRVYIVCSDCEKAGKANGAGARPGTRMSAETREGMEVNGMQNEKELQIMGEIAAVLSGTGYQMKHGKNGYMFLNAKGVTVANYLCGDLETALKYAKEIREKGGLSNGK